MKKRTIFSNIYVRNILGLILVTIVLVSAALIWMGYYTQHGKAVEVPDVKGISVELAEPFFTRTNLHFLVVDSVFNKNATPGSITETTPPVGSKVKEGRTIYLKVNAYLPPFITIPVVKDTSQRQSYAMLRSLGFESINTKMVPGVYRNLVVGLESRGIAMEAGQRVPANMPLSLLVSSGSGDDFLTEMPEDSVVVGTDESWF
jgi:beta-lactam-binding protein with PASTA domain